MNNCPKCGSDNYLRERRLNGNTQCLDCRFVLSSKEWDSELQTEVAELKAKLTDYEAKVGISSRLRGNPLEIEENYLISSLKLTVEVNSLKLKLEEAVRTIDNLEVAHEAVLQDRIGYQVMLSESQHREGELRIQVNHLDKELTTALCSNNNLVVCVECNKHQLPERCTSDHFDNAETSGTTYVCEACDLKEQLEHDKDISYELGQNLLAAQDQNHYFVLMGEYRDKFYELEKKMGLSSVPLVPRKEHDELKLRMEAGETYEEIMEDVNSATTESESNEETQQGKNTSKDND